MEIINMHYALYIYMHLYYYLKTISIKRTNKSEKNVQKDCRAT